MEEIWKSILDYEEYYEVSNLGNIRNIKTNRILKQSVSFGYKRIKLTKNGKGKEFSVHRVVLQSFTENSDNKPIVNHKDGDKFNNYLNNLEWCTAKENVNHAVNTGLMPSGINHPKAKLTKEDVLNIIELRKSGVRPRDIMKMYNIGRSTASFVSRGIHYSLK